MEEKELNEETKKVLREANEGKNLVGPFNSVEELFEDLKK